MKTSTVAAALLLYVNIALTPAVFSSPSGIVINGVEITQQQVAYYQMSIPAGRYWYDRTSGLWGQEGGPSVGQIPANLDLGGPLQTNASGASTGVFVNGREILPVEIQRLMLLVGQQVPLGRYWLRADGVGGVEGGPASFSLVPNDGGAESSPVFEDQMADFCAQNGGCPW